MLSDQEKITQDYYAKNAQWWANKHQSNFWHNEHRKFSSFLPKGKIIDLGCGSGNDAAWFIENNYSYLGIDASEAMLEEARKRNPKGNFLKKDFYQLDFPADEFDGFWAACSFLHVPKSKISTVLQSVRRIIKNNGIGFIALKEGEGEKIEDSKHSSEKRFFAKYNLAEFGQILKENNFEVIETGEYLYSSEDKSVFLFYFVRVNK